MAVTKKKGPGRPRKNKKTTQKAAETSPSPSLEEAPRRHYFAKESLELFHSGSAILDCILGGGWAENRILNITGDSATYKTGLGWEAVANFLTKYPNGQCRYIDTEMAIDLHYIENSLGIDLSQVTFVDEMETVEDWFEDMDNLLKSEPSFPSLYVVDSLDGLSSRAEMERKIDDPTYGQEKAKKIGEILRRLDKQLSKTNITVLTMSQTRDNIGVSFGEKKTRSGGKSIRFYASQELWLAQIKQVKKTVKKVERAIGTIVRSKMKKNRIGPPFREADLHIRFGYGIEDIMTDLSWLESVGRAEEVGLSEDEVKSIFRNGTRGMDKEEIRTLRSNLYEAVVNVWDEIETQFMPAHTKY